MNDLESQKKFINKLISNLVFHKIMSFWDKAKENAIQVKIRRAKTMAKGNINSDFDKDHPDWVSQAQRKPSPDYVDLVKKITLKTKKLQDAAIAYC